MKNKEAIESLKWKVEYAKEIGEHHVDCVYVDALALAVKALEAQESSSWIPVSKSLPEKKGYFLTSTVFNEVYCDFWNGEMFERTEMIIAWMPLPEPYKREETTFHF